jgi:hypothetical protein
MKIEVAHGWFYTKLQVPPSAWDHLHRSLTRHGELKAAVLSSHLLTHRTTSAINLLVDWQSCWLTDMLHQNRIRSWCSAWISLPGILHRSTLQAKLPALTEVWQHEIVVRESENVFSSKPLFKILSSPNIVNVSVLVELRNPTAVPLLNGGVEANTKPTTRPEVQTDSELNSSLPTVAS